MKLTIEQILKVATPLPWSPNCEGIGSPHFENYSYHDARPNGNYAYARHAANVLPEVLKAFDDYINAQKTADKQWLGLNMNDPGQKRAYEIMRDAKSEALKVMIRANEIEV